ncbi:MAG: PstS family phosphate ABC transporter substrate-binding protein, partial [Euzebya sp.]
MRLNWRSTFALTAVLAIVATGCASDDPATNTSTPADQSTADEATADEPTADEPTADEEGDPAPADLSSLSGTIQIDGSSTVGPLTDAIAEEFAGEAPDVVVNLGISGTGGGFERFCGEG